MFGVLLYCQRQGNAPGVQEYLCILWSVVSDRLVDLASVGELVRFLFPNLQPFHGGMKRATYAGALPQRASWVIVFTSSGSPFSTFRGRSGGRRSGCTSRRVSHPCCLVCADPEHLVGIGSLANSLAPLRSQQFPDLPLDRLDLVSAGALAASLEWPFCAVARHKSGNVQESLFTAVVAPLPYPSCSRCPLLTLCTG